MLTKGGVVLDELLDHALSDAPYTGNPTWSEAKAEVARARALGVLEQTRSACGKAIGAVRTREAVQAFYRMEAQKARITNALKLAFREGLITQEASALLSQFSVESTAVEAVVAILVAIGLRDSTDLVRAESENIRIGKLKDDNLAAHDRVLAQLAALAGLDDLGGTELEGSGADQPPKIDHDQELATVLANSPEVRLAQATASWARSRTLAAESPDGADCPAHLQAPRAKGPVWVQSTTGCSNDFLEAKRANVLVSHGETAAAQDEIQRVHFSLRARFEREIARRNASLHAADRFEELAAREQNVFQGRFASYANPFNFSPPSFLDVQTAQHASFYYRLARVDALGQAWRAFILIRGYFLCDGFHPAVGEWSRGLAPPDLERVEPFEYQAAAFLPL